jgi:hypothetical protein
MQHPHEANGGGSIKKGDFFLLFWRAWMKTLREKLILSAFGTVGLSPFNPDQVLAKHAPARSSTASSLSGYEGADWRQIDRTFKRAVEGDDEKSARLPRRSLHKLSVHNELLHLENEQLNKVIKSKKKHKGKGITLDLQKRKAHHYKPLFWSPCKVREARFRARVNEQQQLEEEAEKADRELARASTALRNKLEKERRSKAYKEKLENAKVKRAQEAAERACKQKERDAQKSIQLPKAGKHKASQEPSAIPHKKNRSVLWLLRMVLLWRSLHLHLAFTPPAVAGPQLATISSSQDTFVYINTSLHQLFSR